MEILLCILGWLLALLGLVGAFVPVLPGPLLAFCGMIPLACAGHLDMTAAGWTGWCAAMLLVSTVDYILPGWMAKRFGGSRAGMIGATVGAVAGLFFGPLGVILGPFVGAVAGEMLRGSGTFQQALHVGIGSFMAFLVGTGIKLIYASAVITKMLFA